MSTPQTTFLFVHGAWHTGWCWHKVAKIVEDAGHRALTPDLPLTGSDSDSAAIEALLDQTTDSVVLVGHSYGGVILSHAASSRSDVRHLVYVAAFCERPDESRQTYLQEPYATGLASCLQLDGELMSFDRGRAAEIFYADCDATDQRKATERLRPMATPELTTEREPAWMTIPSTYVICERDAALHPEAQAAMAVNATKVERLDTDHSPFLSTPEALAEILLRAAATS